MNQFINLSNQKNYMTSTLKISEKGKLYKSETSDLMIMLQPNRGMNINEIYVKRQRQ